MQTLRTSTFLRWTLLADAATCVATGLLMTLGSGQLEQFLGLPAGPLRYAGVSLLLSFAITSSRHQMPHIGLI
jgi:hypothetical protein